MKKSYYTFKVPVFLARGVGYTPIPRPVKLTHFLSDPIQPPVAKEDPVAFKKQVTRFHKKLEKSAHDLIAEAVSAARALPLPKDPDLTAMLLGVAQKTSIPTETRIDALAALPAGLMQVEPKLFDFLLESIDPAQPPALRTAAAVRGPARR